MTTESYSEKEVGDLRNLKTVNQLQTLISLRNEVQTLNLKTSQLESSSQARSQDFLALYRSTQTTANNVMNNSLSISQIQNNMNMSQFTPKERCNTTGKSLQILEHRQNQTDEYLSQLEHRHNVTHDGLYSKIEKASEKVMMTVCTSRDVNYNYPEVIKYNALRTSKGISNTAKVLSSGIFICEKPGLYIVMVSMRGNSLNSYYWIKKNNTNMLFIESIRSNDGLERSVSGSFPIDLVIGDSIYVTAHTSVRVMDNACLSVVKIN